MSFLNETESSPIEPLSNNTVVKIDDEDIRSEVDFWSSSIICYVIGANPPVYVMEGFIRRIWKNLGVDKVGMLKTDVFIVRFRSMEMRDSILNGSPMFF